MKQLDLLANAYDINTKDWHTLRNEYRRNVIIHSGEIFIGDWDKRNEKLIVTNNERKTLTLEPARIQEGNKETGWRTYITGFMILEEATA